MSDSLRTLMGVILEEQALLADVPFVGGKCTGIPQPAEHRSSAAQHTTESVASSRD
jgi:hypothetical protein